MWKEVVANILRLQIVLEEVIGQKIYLQIIVSIQIKKVNEEGEVPQRIFFY